jgi:hypothetical protein
MYGDRVTQYLTIIPWNRFGGQVSRAQYRNVLDYTDSNSSTTIRFLVTTRALLDRTSEHHHTRWLHVLGAIRLRAQSIGVLIRRRTALTDGPVRPCVAQRWGRVHFCSFGFSDGTSRIVTNIIVIIIILIFFFFFFFPYFFPRIFYRNHSSFRYSTSGPAIFLNASNRPSRMFTYRIPEACARKTQYYCCSVDEIVRPNRSHHRPSSLAGTQMSSRPTAHPATGTLCVPLDRRTGVSATTITIVIVVIIITVAHTVVRYRDRGVFTWSRYTTPWIASIGFSFYFLFLL